MAKSTKANTWTTRFRMNNLQLPTLEDVAKLAQVSTATVSRCLNTPDRVAKSTRGKVDAAVLELGYSPNFGAKALASKRTNTYGAIIPTLDNAIFARGLQAFQTALTEHGATLLVSGSYYDPEVEEQQIRAMVARGADGLMLIGKSRSDSIYRFLEKRDIPFVLAWNYDPSSEYHMVGFDNALASGELTQKAIELGHRHFAFICAERENNDRAADRILGAQKVLALAGLDPDAMPVIETPYSIDEAGNAFEKLMQADNIPSVVMCGNDVQAVGALKRARELALKVPADVSITGFDDLEIASAVDPGITTIHVPHRQMGRQSASILTSFSRDIPAAQIKLNTSLIERGSLAPPKK